jgi:hypothetical protein
MEIIEDALPLIATVRNFIIVCMAWASTLFIGKALPLSWVKIYRLHVAPIIILVVCMVAVWIPGLRPGLEEGQVEIAGIDGNEPGFRIALGVILALAAYVTPVIIMWAAEKYLPPNVVKQIRKILF